MNPITSQMHNHLRAIGYEEVWTGGGCKALQRLNADGTLMVVMTDENGAYLPHWGDTIIVGLYPFKDGDFDAENGEQFDLAQGQFGYRAISVKPLPQEVEEILQALENTGNEVGKSGGSGRKAELLRRLNAQRTGVQMHIASLETRHFKFTGYGSSVSEARTALELTLVHHAEQYDLNEDWADDLAEDVFEKVVVLGAGYRDDECLTDSK